MIRLRPVGLAAAACLVLTFLVFAGPGAGHGTPKPTQSRQGDSVRLRRHAPRPDGALRQEGLHAHLQRSATARGQRAQRAEAGLPAEHRSRLVHVGHGHVAGSARLHEQHVPSGWNRLHDGHVVRNARNPAGRHDAAVRRARREEDRLGRVGRRPGGRARGAGTVVDFRSFFSDRGVLVNYDLPGPPALG